MSSILSPMSQAHQHAHNADDYHSRGLLIPAAEEHYKAAEFYQACIDQCGDDNTKRTLRMLYADNAKAGKDLQRKIAKLKEEGKDPSLPQVALTSRTPHPAPPPNARSATSTSTTPRARMLDSPSNTVDESFMVLNQQPPEPADDPFDIFWKVTGEMMENLSQPISFPTAALAAFEAAEASPGRSGNTEKNRDSWASSRKKTRPLKHTHNDGPASMQTSSTLGDDEPDDEDYDSSDSFCVIPTREDAESSSSALRKENAALKVKMETMQKQVESVRKQMAARIEQDMQLREHIVIARKEAQRAMVVSTTATPRSGQSTLLDLPALNINVPPPPPAHAAVAGAGRDREAQFLRRIRELEEENRVMRTEFDKQKTMIVKYRERWERLKESAKRKRSAKAAAHAESSTVRERIDEEPEAEEEAEEQSRDSGNS